MADATDYRSSSISLEPSYTPEAETTMSMLSKPFLWAASQLTHIAVLMERAADNPLQSAITCFVILVLTCCYWWCCCNKKPPSRSYHGELLLFVGCKGTLHMLTIHV